MNSRSLTEKVSDIEIPLERAATNIDAGNQCATPKVTTFYLLGNFQLIQEDAPVMILDVPRLQSLLAYLAIHHSAPQSRAHLAFMLWPDSMEAQARTNLRNLLYKLRQKLPDAEQILHIDRHTLQWLHDTPGLLDVLDFERAVSYADKAEHNGDRFALRLALEQAAQLYRGNLLPGCYDEWILPIRDRLNQLFLGVLERLMELLEREGNYQEAIRVAQRLLRHDPLHEAAYRNLMRLYVSSGNRAAAERTYQNCITVLERELAMEPSTATREVYEQYVQRDTASTPETLPRLPFVLRVQNRWVKVSPQRWLEVGKRASKPARALARECPYYTRTSLAGHWREEKHPFGALA